MTIINTNVKSLIAQDSLRVNNNNLATAMERLSTGKKINSASDDAAGLSISARMTSQIRGLNMAVKNANDGISLAQTAEGAMNEVTNMLQRMRELAVQAGNGTNSAADLASLNDEVGQLKAEIDRIANTTQFNNMNILDGSFAGKLQIGANADQTMDLAVKSVNTAKMGESVDGLAKGATKASLAVSGLSTNAADYAGLSFNASVNGVNATVTLPVAAAAQPSQTAAIQAADRVITQNKIQVGAFEERYVDLTAAGKGSFKMAVNDGSEGTLEIDVEQAAIDLGMDARRVHGDQMVQAIQYAIDKSAYFTGDNAVTVSQDINNNIVFEVAGGDKKIALTEIANNGLLSSLKAGAATTAGDDFVGVTTPLSMVTLTATPADASESFGMKQFDVVTGTNDSLSLKLGDANAVTLTIAAGNYDNMSDVAVAVQTQINNNGLFSGQNAVTVSAVRDENYNWGLNFSSANGQNIKLSGNFMTAASGAASSVNQTTAVLVPGKSDITLTEVAQFGEFKEQTISLADVKGKTGNAGNSMLSFKLNVNNGGEVVVTMDTSAANLLKLGMPADFSSTAVTKDQFVTLMQDAIDTTGFFTGDNKVTVGVSDAGQVTMSVAGGIGSIKVAENTLITNANAYDGLIYTLTGTNNGNTGGAMESVMSGGTLVLGSSVAANQLPADQVPSGQVKLAISGTATAAALVFKLKDSEGNVQTITTAALAGGDTVAQIATAINTQLAKGTGYSAAVDPINASQIVIKNASGNDFSIQLASTNGAVFSPDNSSPAPLIKDGAYVSSAQVPKPFGMVMHSVGAGDGGSAEVQKVTLALNGGSLAAGETLTADGFTYTLTAADTSLDILANNFITAYNSSAPNANFVATKSQTAGVINFTAKYNGNIETLVATTTIDSANTGTATAAVVTEGVDATYQESNVLTLKIGSAPAVDVKVATSDFEYSSLSQLRDKVQSAIDSEASLQGDNRVIVGINTDAVSGKSGLTFTQASGQSLSVSGSFIGNELKAESRSMSYSTSGGLDLSANNTLDVTMQDASTGNSVTKTVTLASSSANVSLSDYASLVQSAVNSAFANEGVSVSTSYSNGEMSVSLGQVGNKTLTIGGASMTAAIGQSVTVSNVPTSGMTNMDDVAQAISDDLAAVGAKATFDAATGQLTFDVVGGADGTSSTIALSGAGLASVQIAGNLSASGVAGDATAVKLSEVSVTSAANATEAIKSIDNAIQYVSNQRSYLGAIQNRLDYTVNNLTNIVTNTSASRSRIEDADYGTETAALAKNQIMSQAATAMLAQANQSAQNVLSLLK